MKNLNRIILILVMISAFSCQDDKTPSPSCVGGAGGSFTVVAFPQHHTKPIFSSNAHPDSAFIRYNSLEQPTSVSGYNQIVVGEAGEEHVHIKNLKCGNYFIFMAGYDTTIKKRVTGGLPVTISDNSSTEKDVNVPVTE